jgi:hypothetical protein
MQDWWTYSLTDFLLFSPRTYYRLFELYNAAVWPAHAVTFVLGALILILIWRRQHPTIVWLVLATMWVWVAAAFHLERYATINWAATYFAIAFALEAIILLLSSARAFDGRPSGLILFTLALAYPLVALAVGRPFAQAEAFGIAPDPTAIATLGILLSASRTRFVALIIPLLWLTFSTLTLFAMAAPDRWILSAITAACVVLTARGAIMR